MHLSVTNMYPLMGPVKEPRRIDQPLYGPHINQELLFEHSRGHKILLGTI